MQRASTFFTKEQQDHILAAIKEAEQATSGEIRVHVETSLSGESLDRAAWIFRKLGMHKTADRNGVLFYLATGSKKFAIIGDSGINAKVPEGFWDQVKDLMEKHFTEGRFTEGLAKGVLMAGLKLKEHFPYRRDDVNELRDDLSFDEPGQTAI
jgi:uncharacterized membrane protein